MFWKLLEKKDVITFSRHFKNDKKRFKYKDAKTLSSNPKGIPS